MYGILIICDDDIYIVILQIHMYLMYDAANDVDDITSTHSYHDGISDDDVYDGDDIDADLLMMMLMMIY